MKYFIILATMALAWVTAGVHEAKSVSNSGHFTISATVTAPSCTVIYGANQTVAFGEYMLDSFPTVMTDAKVATVILSCSATTTRVTATLSGTPHPRDTTVFANSGTATVYALVTKSSSDTDKISNGSTWSVTPSANLATFKIYVRLGPDTTPANMKPGTVNIPLTLTFTYS